MFLSILRLEVVQRVDGHQHLIYVHLHLNIIWPGWRERFPQSSPGPPKYACCGPSTERLSSSSSSSPSSQLFFSRFGDLVIISSSERLGSTVVPTRLRRPLHLYIVSTTENQSAVDTDATNLSRDSPNASWVLTPGLKLFGILFLQGVKSAFLIGIFTFRFNIFWYSLVSIYDIRNLKTFVFLELYISEKIKSKCQQNIRNTQKIYLSTILLNIIMERYAFYIYLWQSDKIKHNNPATPCPIPPRNESWFPKAPQAINELSSTYGRQNLSVSDFFMQGAI